MKKDYVAVTAGAPDASEYAREEIPYDAPGRPLRSFDELATIAVARDVFYGEDGQPNELWRRFVNAFSLYSYTTPSVNGASAETLAGLGVSDAVQQRQLNEFLGGSGAHARQGPGFFKSPSDVSAMFGAQSPAAQLVTQISALRIIVTVREARASFRLNALIAPPGGAKIPVASPNQAEPTKKPADPEDPNKSAANSGPEKSAKKLNYPFTVLEFRENDEMPSSTTSDRP